MSTSLESIHGLLNIYNILSIGKQHKHATRMSNVVSIFYREIYIRKSEETSMQSK